MLLLYCTLQVFTVSAHIYMRPLKSDTFDCALQPGVGISVASWITVNKPFPTLPSCPTVCSVDPLREAAESREGSPERHPVPSPTHDSRQEVPPQDIQVQACLSTITTVC